MLRQLYRRNPPLRIPFKISSASYVKYKKIAAEKKEQQQEASKKRALQSFDDFYQKVYSNAWPSIRVALLCPSKEAILVNNFSDRGRILNELEDKNLLSVTNLYDIRLAELSGSENESHSDSESDNIDYKERYEEKLDDEFLKLSKARTNEEEDEFSYLNSHLTKKMHDDPTVNVPLEETLAAAKIDKSRIVEPQETGTALSAALNEFIPATELIGKDPDWVLSSDRYRSYERSTNVLVDVEPEEALHFPPNLLVYSYERGNVMDYDYPRRGATGTIDYEIIELGHLLPVLALGIEPEDRVLDMFTQSTDFGLIMLQSLYPDLVVMNLQGDVRSSELQRKLHLTFKHSEFPAYKITKQISSQITGEYNKILVCVPNMNDRRCVKSADTYFHPMLSRERLMLPEVQIDHLIDAIKLVEPGGTVVYSTATLSPLQNEGVIRTAIGRLRYDHGIEVVVKDLTQALEPLDTFFKFASPKEVSLGHMAVPFLPLNCGPRYFCKMVKAGAEDASVDGDISTNS